MAKQTINLGTTVNDGTGDTLRAGGDKINDNFDELYVAVTQAVQTATYASPTTTINAVIYKNWKLTATGSTVISLTNAVDGDAGTINVIISGAGGYTITFDTMFTKKYGSTSITVVTGNDNLISWTKLGTDILYTIIQKV